MKKRKKGRNMMEMKGGRKEGRNVMERKEGTWWQGRKERDGKEGRNVMNRKEKE
jgi:hypothetical protein